MRLAGICKVIPSFPAAQHYASMLHEGFDRPKTDASSPLAVDFVRFGATVQPQVLGDIEMAAWTVDLSLDLQQLLPLVGGTCETSSVAEDPSFKKYMMFLTAITRWTSGLSNASVAQALARRPLLLPLDVARAPWTEPLAGEKLNTFIECMSKDVKDGGWSTLFSSRSGPSVSWLLSFSLPLDLPVTYDFYRQLRNVSRSMGQRAVVMAGAQALRLGGANPVDSLNLHEDFTTDDARYRRVFEEYLAVEGETGNLDGFVYDEWVDDWDRGAHGPFWLASETVQGMRQDCAIGGRFSHDVTGCAQVVGSGGRVHPEFLGLASASSRALRHCIHPRFSRSLFSPEAPPLQDVGMRCAFMLPSVIWLRVAVALLAFVASIQISKMLARWCLATGGHRAPPPARQLAGGDRGAGGGERPTAEEIEPRIGYITVRPREPILCGQHTIELQSARLRSHEEAGWWLWMHASAQMGILERQVSAEVGAQRALRARRQYKSNAPEARSSTGGRRPTFALEASSVESQASFREDVDVSRAMQVVHRRALEGFASWCSYAAGSSRSLARCGLRPSMLYDFERDIQENYERPAARLFAEVMLLRTMESLGEHILQCPERISFLLCRSFLDAGGLADVGPTAFAIDLDSLQDGLEQMHFHSNPYTRRRMPSGRWELGINFDDINESGIQCRERVAKTYKEPASLMVLVDFVLCYRVPIMIKVYCLVVSGYIYLGSREGDDISTSHNGSLWEPRWLRINYLQYTAMLDAAIWTCLEVLLVIYVAWQRWPSLGRRSPGVPGLKWFMEHLCNLVLSSFGGVWVYASRWLAEKPWECAQSDVGKCFDSRSLDLWGVLRSALVYWAGRAVIFVLLNMQRGSIFLYGTPDRKARKESGRGRGDAWALDAQVYAAWFVMLSVCVLVEVQLLLPAMKGLDWATTCGAGGLGEITGLPTQQGACSDPDHVLSFGCVTCLSSVSAGWLLVLLGSMVDIYFVFYFASAIVGSAMGHRRGLNDLKNTTLPVDLREHQGREALSFESAFGPGWKQIWRVMVKSLWQESLVSPAQAAGLAWAAGISIDGDAPLTHRDRRQKPIHLSRFPRLAAERLAFFFQSLRWIDRQAPGKSGGGFEEATDSLTGVRFDPGSIPSLTQIIPAYNEVVIPSVEFLRAGADPEDAKNGSADNQPGLGDLTVPPQGDGVNTNLAFMISQFPDEWVFLAKRLGAEGLAESAESQDLYNDFIKDKLSPNCIVEVCLWAALRMQSVAKTVIGALQYGRALASLPKVKEHYAQFPEKRVAEDHVEVILAHQTYGHAEGSEKNDEAVRLLLERYADDAIYLVFDLKKGSSAELWNMVENFLAARGGYTPGAFEQASVKCRWDRARCGLRVLEVLPRKFPLRLGQGDFKTQGKACNQLNGLRFASGHYVQALDCNMGAFIGECFKVPYVLRMFMPLHKDDRTVPCCRYLGFREYIYTCREGTVGKCHAAAEWTFGTIYQRFLSGMGMRMHYGHPDFLDGFWARNRGGMSKSSPVVNLSEDIFAGFNVRMRGEASPHIDALEFEKGREATFNAASNFFSKISGGSIAVLRSRDNHLLCERIGILHSLSFYFTSVAFYMSNLLVDLSIYLYVLLFILFSLAGLGPAQLAALGSTFSMEWIVSMGIVALVPQFCEMVLELGAVHAVKELIGGLLSATFFYIFQNKNIASSMKEGAMTGIARYFFTGRPPANQHQTWKDNYLAYWRSHYGPALSLVTGYLIYTAVSSQSNGKGKLPMVLVIISIVAWLITPIVFSPLPRWNLIRQDLREFNSFIISNAGTLETDIPEVITRGAKGTMRSLYECGLAEELSAWVESPLPVLVSCLLAKAALGAYLLLVLPAEVLDFLPAFLVALSLSWVVVLGYFLAGLSNVFLVVSFLIWPAAVPLAHLVIGSRFSNPSFWTRTPEYTISLSVFLFALGLAKDLVLTSCRVIHSLAPCLPSKRATGRLHECVRVCFVYFFVHQRQFVEAYAVLGVNLAASAFLAASDYLCCNCHTWFVLNSELARTRHGRKYMEKNATFFELDDAWRPDFWAPEEGGPDASPQAEPNSRAARAAP